MAGEPTPSYPEFREAAAQDAITGTKLARVGADDIEFEDAAAGPILRSADGTRWRILVDSNGMYTATEVT